MLWSSLARHPTLSALTHLYPPSTALPPRTHIPTTFVPAFQNLTSLSVLDIDRSCSPDDFSRVVFGTPGLENPKTLRLSWVHGNAYEKQKGDRSRRCLGSCIWARVQSLCCLTRRRWWEWCAADDQETHPEKAGLDKPLYSPRGSVNGNPLRP